MKYFFLSDGWIVGRVWGVGGEWSQSAWRRAPEIQKLDLCLWDREEKMWLYRVEEAVLMIEVKPTVPEDSSDTTKNIGNVVLSRFIDAEQVIDRLGTIAARCQSADPQLM